MSFFEPLQLRSFLEGLYWVYNRRELVDPDPLMFLYAYDTPQDREVAGLVASCLAYGRVVQILKSVSLILEPMGRHPHLFLLRNKTDLSGLYKNFKHRFTTGEQMAFLLAEVARVLRDYGTLECFMGECLKNDTPLLEALNRFSRRLVPERKGFPLLTAPEEGSACKRLLLYLKWMVRKDDVDPGGWSVIVPKDLIMPTDTHIHNIALQLGLTARKQADLKTALEITRSFAQIAPEDPTRYDFVLTRFGIRSGLDVAELVKMRLP